MGLKSVLLCVLSLLYVPSMCAVTVEPQELFLEVPRSARACARSLNRKAQDDVLTKLLVAVEARNRALMRAEIQAGWDARTSPLSSERDLLIRVSLFLFVLRDELRYSHPNALLQDVSKSALQEYLRVRKGQE